MSNISLDLYKTFATVAKHKSMSKASDELMVSQPAISKAIKTLEEQIGGTLFNRSNKGLELTDEGKALYDRIVVALDLIANAETEFDSFKKLEVGEVKIGISSVLSKCFLVDVLKIFRQKYPKVKITITNGLTSNLIEKLNNGYLDFVIYNESGETYNANIKELTKTYYTFFHNPNLYPIERCEGIDELVNYDVILQQKGSNTRDLLDKYTDDIQLEPVIEVMSQDLICHLVENGLGVGFALEELVINNPNFTRLEVSAPSVVINLATNKSIEPSFAAKTFIKELKNNI